MKHLCPEYQKFLGYRLCMNIYPVIKESIAKGEKGFYGSLNIKLQNNLQTALEIIKSSWETLFNEEFKRFFPTGAANVTIKFMDKSQNWIARIHLLMICKEDNITAFRWVKDNWNQAVQQSTKTQEKCGSIFICKFNDPENKEILFHNIMNVHRNIENLQKIIDNHKLDELYNALAKRNLMTLWGDFQGANDYDEADPCFPCDCQKFFR